MKPIRTVTTPTDAINPLEIYTLLVKSSYKTGMCPFTDQEILSAYESGMTPAQFTLTKTQPVEHQLVNPRKFDMGALR